MEAREVEQSNVRVGPQGRVVIPARMRAALDIASGDELLARVEGRRVVLEKREDVLRRVRDRFAGVSGKNLTDELISERREEARRSEGR